jgi:signal peptidase I
MTLQWFLSRRVRAAGHTCKHVQKVLSEQRDLLSPDAIEEVQKSISHVRNTIRERPNRSAIEASMSELQTVIDKCLKPYPNAGHRERVEMLLVTVAIVLGIWTFFLKSFKIPTGSMQPTLYGVTHENLIDRPDIEFPNGLQRFFTFCYRRVSHTHIKAADTGEFRVIDQQPLRVLVFNLRQRFQIGNAVQTIWFPPDDVFRRAALIDWSGSPVARIFQKGEDVIKIKAISGDHLFVDRLTYNFRPPKRGEIIVFKTKGISALPQDEFYIKRLVALGGEAVRIGNDRHLVINGKRLDANTPRFKGVYSFNPKEPPRDSQYSGHLNDSVVQNFYRFTNVAPLFRHETDSQTVKPNHYMVMGDNTLNSSDSRTWGDFPRENVIGKSFFVFWPIGSQNDRASRFGWGTR